MNSSTVFAAIFTVLAVASFAVSGADSVSGWAMLVIANIHGATNKIQSNIESLKESK